MARFDSKIIGLVRLSRFDKSKVLMETARLVNLFKEILSNLEQGNLWQWKNF